MKRGMAILKFTVVVAAVWLTGAADWPTNEVLGLLGDVGCC